MINLLYYKQYNFSTAIKQFQIKWFTKNKNIRNVGRQPARNIIEGEISPLEPSKDVTTLFEAWHLSVIDELLEKIVTNTIEKFPNLKIDFKKQ